MGGSLLTLSLVERTVPYQSIEDRQNLKLTNYLSDSGRRLPALNFEAAARSVTPLSFTYAQHTAPETSVSIHSNIILTHRHVRRAPALSSATMDLS
ncbi:MAG: hypothetical protein WDO15_22440 [Bacteroidota bacterium]